MKKLLFSSHPVFLSIIKRYFSDSDKYLILGVQEKFAKSLQDIDVQNIKLFSADSDIESNALEYSVKIIKQEKKFPEKYKDFAIFNQFLSEYDKLLYKKIYDLIAFLLVLDREKPDIIILHNDVEPFMRILALWAKENNVPCLHVPHSVIIDSSERTDIGTDIHDIVTSSDICVAGEYQKQWYLDRGIQNDHIHVIGLPQFDQVANSIYDKNRAFRLLKLDPSKPVITYASSWRQDTNLLGCHDGIEQTYINFLKACKSINIRPIIKLHPNSSRGNIDWHVMIAKKVGIHAIVSIQHLYTILQASDILFAYGPSNILLEGSFYPIRLMTTHGYDNDNAVFKIGSDPTVEDVASGINELLQLEMPSLDKFRYKYIGASMDGRVGDRLANKIEELLND